MGWRQFEAAQRRQQREAQKRQRELQRRAQELAKLSAIEQARLEVETHENQLEVLLSVHKEQSEPWDWKAFAVSLPPFSPRKNSHHELRARRQELVLLPHMSDGAESRIEQAQLQDEQAFQEAMRLFSEEMAHWQKMKDLASRILLGDHKAYTQALAEFSPLAELSNLGSSIHFTVHNPTLVECKLKVNGAQSLPKEVKTLTASGKLSVKAMPKARFHEIYQDYICGCILRVAREVFALLPIETILINAAADSLDSGTGRTVELIVLSVVIPRASIGELNFEQLDPSDAIETFQHRGHFKASRKSEAFQPVAPLTVTDVVPSSVEKMSFDILFAQVQEMREELKSKVTELNAVRKSPVISGSQSL